MAKFKYLNVNPDGLLEEDCVIRAISLASGIPYQETSEKLWLTADLFSCTRLCRFCYSHYITDVLGYKEVNCSDMLVGEFADKHPHGTYLVRIQGHLTCIIDNCIMDVWDCRNEFCDMAWRVD